MALRPSQTVSDRRKKRRLQLLEKRDPACFYCGYGFDPDALGLPAKDAGPGSDAARRLARPTLEHLVPVSAGGTLARKNCVLAHALCNRLAGVKPLAEKRALALRIRAHLRDGDVVPDVGN